MKNSTMVMATVALVTLASAGAAQALRGDEWSRRSDRRERPVVVQRPCDRPVVYQRPCPRPVYVQRPVVRTVYVERPVTRTVIVERPVTRTVYVERPVERVVYEQPTCYDGRPSYDQGSCSTAQYSEPGESRGKVRTRNALLIGAGLNELFNRNGARRDVREGAIALTLLNEICRR